MTTLELTHPLALRTARGETVRYGSLSFPKAAQADVDTAFAYLSQDSIARSLIDRIEHAQTPHHIKIDHVSDDSYDPSNRTINWDPHSAMRTTAGGAQSPAMGLVHEIDHAAAPLSLQIKLSSIDDPAYDNLEERRVITGAETQIARALHEGLRHDHSGSSYRVPSPIAR